MFTPENLPNLLKQLDQFKEALGQAKPLNLWKYLDECQGALQKVQESLTDPKQKEILGEILAKATVARKEVQDQVPAFLDQMKQQNEKSMAFIKEQAAKIEQTERDFQDKLKSEAELAASAEKPRPAEPLPAVDANHGSELALELLKNMGLLETDAEAKKLDVLGSVARFWTDTGETPEESIAAASPPEPPVEKPAALKPRRATPLRRPPKPARPETRNVDLDQSLGKGSFDDM
ncbi:MAG: hypothetical protein AB7K24_04135 [Gemmataceae bacterium]